VAAYGIQVAPANGTSPDMKRAHKRAHILIWLILAPVLILVIKLAVAERPVSPVNDALPSAITEEAS